MYKVRPVTPRIQELREKYRTTVPEISISRWKLMTEFYQSHPDLNGILKRTEAYRYVCQNLDIAIHDHEMIVGGHAPTFRGGALFNDNSVSWIIQECLDSNMIETRDIDPYILHDEDREYLRETIDYWMGNCTSMMVRDYLPDNYRFSEQAFTCIFNTFEPAGSPVGHFIVGHQRVLDRGLQGIKDEAEEKMALMEQEGIGNHMDEYQFYRGISIVLDGAITLAQRYSDLAARTAAACTDPVRKAELEKIAATMAQVPRYQPRSFFEATQAVFFYQMLVTLDAQLHGTSFGRVDQFLGEYYERDLAAGKITPEEAQEIIDFFMLKVAEQNKPIGYGPTASNPGYTSGQIITIGGVDSRGEDATNAVTYMLLTGSERLVLHSPPLSLRVHKNTPAELWEAAIQTNRRAGGVPTYESDEAIVPALQKRGLSLEDARNYGLVGCVEPAGNGMEWPQCGGDGSESFFLIPNALLVAINDGVNPMKMPGMPEDFEPRRTGLSTGHLYEMESFEEVKQAYKAQVEYFANWHVACSSAYQYVMRWNQPVLIASAGIVGCMESGRDVMNQGAKYTNVGMAAIGTGNVADGLAAIKYMCFDKKLCTTQEFYDAMMANWQGSQRAEEIHAAITKEVPHWGNGDPYVDELGAWGTQVFADAFNGKVSLNGTFHAGLYPVTAHVIMGKMSYAGPDGRYVSDPFSDGISAVQGRDTNGPTAVLATMSKIDCTEFSNGTLLNMKFSPSTVTTPESRAKLAELMKAYLIDQKGMEMQLNIVSTKQMKEARENPEKYRDLVVRIAGFSAYFVEIQEDAKDDLIARTEMEEL